MWQVVNHECTQACLDYSQECGCFCLPLWHRILAADHSTIYEACRKLREKALQKQTGCVTVHNAVPATLYLGFRSVWEEAGNVQWFLSLPFLYYLYLCLFRALPVLLIDSIISIFLPLFPPSFCSPPLFICALSILMRQGAIVLPLGALADSPVTHLFFTLHSNSRSNNFIVRIKKKEIKLASYSFRSVQLCGVIWSMYVLPTCLAHCYIEALHYHIRLHLPLSAFLFFFPWLPLWYEVIVCADFASCLQLFIVKRHCYAVRRWFTKKPPMVTCDSLFYR